MCWAVKVLKWSWNVVGVIVRVGKVVNGSALFNAGGAKDKCMFMLIIGKVTWGEITMDAASVTKGFICTPLASFLL